MSYKNIELKMPKFEFSTPLYDIKEYLTKLGMTTAFSHSADFSAMTSDSTLFIDSISHKAFIKVDEDGTEAAAATVIVDSNLSSYSTEVILNINRAFITIIKDDVNGQILFIGVIKKLS